MTERELSSDQPLTERRDVRPALGHAHYAAMARNAQLTTTAEFIEAQNAEIIYLYKALQGVRDRARRASMRNKVALRILSDSHIDQQQNSALADLLCQADLLR